jgi:UDP-GlcNAc:undecaprenyl-phosphate GlcNAc-1-phosphate transferase
MERFITVILLPLLSGFAVSLLSTPFTIKLAKKFGLIDDPKKRRHPAAIHKSPVPRAGGVPIFVAILVSSLFFMQWERVFIAMLVAGFFVVVVGILDDKYDLSPYLRFFLNIICALIVVGFGASIPFVTNPFDGILYFKNLIPFFGNILPQVLAVFWIVWIMNMLNWSKGVDGQMPGIAAISLVVIGVASLRFTVLDTFNLSAAKIAFITAGAALGFLVFNFYPARIFPGYSSTILGFIIAILSILSSVKLATAALVLALPITDGIFTILRRILAKKSPFWGDKGHLHHILLALGFTQRQIAVFYWTISGLLGFAALQLSSKGKLFAIMFVTILIVGLILTLRTISKNEEND